MLARYSSERRTGCANERPSGSVRGALGNWCPYRDRQRSGYLRFDALLSRCYCFFLEWTGLEFHSGNLSSHFPFH